MTVDEMKIDTENRRSTSTFASWGRLVRLHTAFPTALIPLAVYLTTQTTTTFGALSIIAISATMHMSICTMNDYIDYEDDVNDVEKSMRPLVNDEISLDSAKRFIFISAGASMTLAMLTGFYVFLTSLLGFAIASGYNYYSGQAVHGDVWYVGSILTLAGLGIVVAGSYTSASLLLVGVFAIHGFYQVQEGHMKDLGEDEDNILQWLGVKVLQGRRVMFPRGFVTGTYALKILELSMIVGIVYINLDVVTQYQSYTLGVISIAYFGNMGLYFYSLQEWLSIRYNRGNIVRYITLHEVSAVMLIMMSIIPYNPRPAIFLMIAGPMYLFFVNLLIHNDSVAPDI